MADHRHPGGRTGHGRPGGDRRGAAGRRAGGGAGRTRGGCRGGRGHLSRAARWTCCPPWRCGLGGR
ncbi:MAG TPA: hypothetical protein DCQ64_04980 [Candidatus Rokubacteria bacterium]|nr:hypothetical protein [Candidatus Rokubacteria bacterium]